jgi:Protein of unknown function (DUF3558)
MKNTKKRMQSFSYCLNVKHMLPVVFFVALLLLAACGSSGTTNGNSSATPTTTTARGNTPTTTTTGSGNGIDACSLVTTDQASKILGGSIHTEPNSVTIGTFQANGCGYKSSQGGAASLSEVSSKDTTSAHTMFTQLQQATKASGGSKYQDVSGLGDGAFTNGKILYVLKGKTVMVVVVLEKDATTVVDAEKQFAQDALQKVL